MTGGSDRGLFLQIEGGNAGGCVSHRLSDSNWANVGDTGLHLPPASVLHCSSFFSHTLKCISPRLMSKISV